MNTRTNQLVLLMTLAYAVIGLLLAAGLTSIYLRLDRIDREVTCQNMGKDVVCVHVVTRREVK